jgi:hypothetical protein
MNDHNEPGTLIKLIVNPDNKRMVFDAGVLDGHPLRVVVDWQENTKTWKCTFRSPEKDTYTFESANPRSVHIWSCEMVSRADPTGRCTDQVM